MNRTLDIEASTWAREDLPGFHVRYHLPDDAKVTDSGAAAPVASVSPAVTAETVAAMIAINNGVLAAKLTGRSAVDALLEKGWATTDPVTMRTAGLLLGMSAEEINQYDLTYHERFGWQAPDYNNGETKSPRNPEAANHALCPNRAQVEFMLAAKQ
jgi:hypothetical protein